MKRNLAILGTGSDVGKSITATALLRIISDMGIKCAPFKAQNMSNNSFVAHDGEMARAQVVQAEAARIFPRVDMNPVLLKPLAATKAQLIVHGKVASTIEAAQYFRDTRAVAEKAWLSVRNLQKDFDMLVLEGAGSCAEINLRHVDFCNFLAAEKADANVILVADIDRGGVFAQILGTLDLLHHQERMRVKGIIINRFRGDPSLFEEGRVLIEEKSALPILGVIPHFSHIRIDCEDGLPPDAIVDPRSPIDREKINFAVLLLPQISNFTDFFPLAVPHKTALHFLRYPRDLHEYDALIIPGSKNTREDLNWLYKTGWREKIINYRNLNGQIIGICGGYQMLGETIDDRLGVENYGLSEGFAFLPLHTCFMPQKQLWQTKAECLSTGSKIQGYEIHHGVSTIKKPHQALLRILSRNGHEQNDFDGMISEDKRVWGCYLHGLFDNKEFLLNFLQSFKKQSITEGCLLSHAATKDHHYDLLAHHFSTHLNMDALRAIINDT